MVKQLHRIRDQAMVNKLLISSKTEHFIFIYFFLDHTLNTVNGTYIYLETSSGTNGDRARLISPIYRKSSKICSFTFW